MLIWLDESVLKLDSASSSEALHGLEQVIGALYRGEHLVLGSREVIKSLSGSECLSLYLRKALQSTYSRYATIADLNRKVDTRVIVSYGVVSSIVAISDFRWNVPIEHFGEFGLRKSMLLAENLADAKLLEHAARQHSRRYSLSQIICVEKAAGGGSTTPPCLINHASTERRFVVCISDSDRIHPKQNICATAEKCRDFVADSNVVSGYHDTVAREIENIIPLSFLSLAIPPTHQKAWDDYLATLVGVNHEIHQFSDLKAGLYLSKVLGFKVGTPERAYWVGVAEQVLKAKGKDEECLGAGVCKSAASKAPCDCLLLEGFGDKLLESVLVKLDALGDRKALELATKSGFADLWFMFGRIVYEWGCAAGRIRV